MIKYIVIRTDGRTEFTDHEAAQSYYNSISNAVELIPVDEVPPAEPLPEKETACWRMRSVIELSGLKSQVDELINALPFPDKVIALNAWEYGNTVASSSPLVKGIQQALKLTDQQVYDFFIQAENLPA